MELRELLRSLEERLAQHDNSRREVQDELQEITTKMIEEADSLEERINRELQDSFGPMEERILGIIDKLNSIKDRSSADSLIEQTQRELSREAKYTIKHTRSAGSFLESYKLVTTQREDNHKRDTISAEDVGFVICRLQEHLSKATESKIVAQNVIGEVCTKRRREADETSKRVNDKLETLFVQEDARIQETVKLVRENIGSESPDGLEEAVTKAKVTLVMSRKYELYNLSKNSVSCNYDLIDTEEFSLKWIDFEERQPADFGASFTDDWKLPLSFAFFSSGEVKGLGAFGLRFEVVIKAWEKGKGEDESPRFIARGYNFEDPVHFSDAFAPNTTYSLKMRIKGSNNSYSKWSEVSEFSTPEFETCGWKECPEYVSEYSRYSVGESNFRIATKRGWDNNFCTITGNALLPLNKVTMWNVKITKSKDNNGRGILVGVAPFDINQSEDNDDKYGWYFACYGSSLWSGPPHKYLGKIYGPRKDIGEYVHTGDTVGVVIDTSKGELSFTVNGMNLGVAFEGIPLDKPLVPCVLLRYEGDSVGLDISEVKGNVDDSIPAPSNIRTKSEDAWDTITLTWDAVAGEASFYQIEVDGSKLWDVSASNTFTKRGFLLDTEHSFRVRTVKGTSASEWSGAVKRRTKGEPNFARCTWKTCPDNAEPERKYLLDSSHKIVTKIGNSLRINRGTISLLPNKVTSWNIKILKLSGGGWFWIGVTPSTIGDDNDFDGWYFFTQTSSLWSWAPHHYRGEEYGPRKVMGKYFHEGDIIGVVMDTQKGELSFTVNGIDYGVAYEGIPLDKPLVPCVILYFEGDSVELDTSEVKETKVDRHLPAPSNVAVKSTTYDTITLTWREVEGALFYQIEFDGSRSWDATTTNTFTRSKLLPETEHSFRVRAVRKGAVGKWSDVVKGRTQKMSHFSEFSWKECPEYVDFWCKYSVDEKNPKIVTRKGLMWCIAVVGNSSLPLNEITSLNIKILRSRENNGKGIYAGIASSDINQGVDFNYKKCGWYFACYDSTLWSGPPHKCQGKFYGPRKEDGEYVHTEDTVGVVMDTAKGELSFVVGGVNLGVAYKDIPLGKPLVPCVLIGLEGDSVGINLPDIKEGEGEEDASIPAPSNVSAKSITWDSIILTWDNIIEYDELFYQVEVDGRISSELIGTNSLAKRGFLPETEHSFRIRTVDGNYVSEWSDVVKGRTREESFSNSGWKESPWDANNCKGYLVDENSFSVATKIYYTGSCTIIGNTPTSLNKVSSWNIKILKSKKNNGGGIYIGVAPFDINQNEDDNYNKRGWYFNCYESSLWSGSPHKYRSKEYGPRKENGKHVHTGDCVGVVMDTTIKGELSFDLNGVDFGVAYEEIPLDKPLVPCVILYEVGDSVELIL